MKTKLSLITLISAAVAFSPAAWATCEQGCDNTNTFLGEDALVNTTFGGYPNTAVGYHALFYDTTGYGNSAIGNEALLSNTVGIFNAANGSGALYNNTTGSNNAANGAGALYLNTTASFNTADGFEALHGNTTGSSNTATGYHALYSSTTSSFNTANGANALYANTTGRANTANGYNALFANTTGLYNVANGVSALQDNTIGGSSVANGYYALSNNTIGSNNVAEGFDALFNNTTGSNNIAVGASAGSNLTTGSNNIDIGAMGVAGESNKIRIGTTGAQTATFIAGISGTTVSGGVGVIVGTNGKLGTVVSSARFKEAIKKMDKASETILALQPVTFRYRHELDPAGIPQFGLVAEQVEKVNPDLVARDEQGKPYTVRYEAVNAMLLNEFLKEHRKVEALESKMAKQESTNADQQKVIQALTASLKEQAAQIQKVSAQVAAANPSISGLEASKSPPRLVASK
jgi:uncharacterized coiled-coil protein SlyX